MAVSFTKAFVSGEAFPPSMREAFAARGIHAYQTYATADIGLIAYETSAREGLVVDEDVVLEIVRPGTGDPVPEGEIGEVVVTILDPQHPVIRLALGDLSATMPGASPCGRTNTRIVGWCGRADQTAKVRGMFVRPEQVAAVARRQAASSSPTPTPGTGGGLFGALTIRRDGPAATACATVAPGCASTAAAREMPRL